MSYANSRGQILHGVGGGYACIDNVPICIGGAGGWKDDDTAIIANGADGWVVSEYDLHTKQITRAYPAPVAANTSYAGGGHYASYVALEPPHAERGVYTSTGRFRVSGVPATDHRSVEYAQDAGLMGMGPDGAIAYKPLQQSYGPTMVRELDGSEWQLTPNHAYALHMVGQRRAIWIDSVTGLSVVGMPMPKTLPGAVWFPHAVLMGDEWWICYYSGVAGLILHPFNSLEGFTVVPLGTNAWPVASKIDDRTIQVAWASNEAESPGSVQTRHFDLLDTPRLSLVPVVAPIVVPVISRPMWMGFFVGLPDSGGGWTTTILPASLPGNCYLTIPEALMCTKDGKPLARYCQGNPDADSDSIDRVISEAPAGLPTVAYWPRKAWGRVPKGATWIGVEAYWLLGESVENFEREVREAVARCPRVVVIPQCFTSNSTLTTDLATVALVVARIARDCPNVEGILAFNGSGRGTGLQDHKEMIPLWEQIAKGIPTTPVFVPPQPPEKPKEPQMSTRRTDPAPSFDQWIKHEFPLVRQAYIDAQGHEPNDEWAAFITTRRYRGWIDGSENWEVSDLVKNEKKQGPVVPKEEP